MEFTVILLVWLAACALYLQSKRQTILKSAIDRPIAIVTAAFLLVLSIFILSLSYPITSSVLAILVAIMALLPCITILSAYSKQHLTIATSTMTSIVVCLTFVKGVV